MFLLCQTLAIITLIYYRISILQFFGLDLQNQKRSILSFLVDLKRWDQIFRLLQFVTIFLAGYFELVPKNFPEYGYFLAIARISQLNQSTKIMFNFRRIIRLMRVPSISKYMTSNWKQSHCKLAQRRILQSGIILTDSAANLFFVSLFIIDAISIVFQLGWFIDTQLQEKFDFISQTFWMTASLFCIISNVLKLLHKRKTQICVVGDQTLKKSRKIDFTYAQIIRCMLDIIAAYAFLNHDFMFKRTLGSVGIVSSILLLADFFR